MAVTEHQNKPTELTQSEQEPATEERSPEQSAPRLSVIGIGASAGGLAALRSFFAAMPLDPGITFVVVTHLSPEHESLLPELLQTHTQMPVAQVTERVEMQPNHVYVIPPGKHLVVEAEHLELTDLVMPRGKPLQIDTFFRSLAEHHGDGGAVILSGSGSDGAVGIQSIKDKNGLILVQDPAEAEFNSMPQSAINTGLVDIVAPVAELATQLVAAKRTRANLELPSDPRELSKTAERTLTQILVQLRLRTGHDFSGYKRAMLLRRIGRRMQLAQLHTLSAYLYRLRQDGEECDALYRDLLIHVTEFFRDPESWEALIQEIVPALFSGKGQGETVRVWVVGCATGEEAYTAGMLLMEHADRLDDPPQIQIFASDLGHVALEFARQGIYPQAIAANISEERLERFFKHENSHYRVRSKLRDIVLFTHHNLLQDPPFSRLDLILCRNVLIYLQREIQERVFESLHYGLRPHGYLFLGSAESVDDVSNLFLPIDKGHHIYRRISQNHGRIILPSLPLQSSLLHEAGGHETGGHEKDAARQLPPLLQEDAEHRLLLEEIAPPSLLVDEAYNVLHLSETVGHYLKPTGGAFSSDATRLVRPELQAELSTALARAFVSGLAVRTRPVMVQFNGTSRPVSLLVHPASRHGRALILFLEESELTIAASESHNGASKGEPTQAESELHLARKRLQSMREEYETTVEELRAANEELQSTNEEYRSTMEELETSKEELQSINEELHTVNQELKSKVEETMLAHSDLQNLFVATEIATLFLDRELRIKRYTPTAAELFNLMPADQGRPIGHLRANLTYPDLEADARRVLAKLTPIEREVPGEADGWFLVGLRPYRTVEDHIDGVVITFVDITTNKQHEQALRAAKEYAESITETIPNMLLVLESNLCVRSANRTFYETFQLTPEETEGRLIYDVGNGPWDIPALHTLLEEILPHQEIYVGYEIDHAFPEMGRRTLLLNGRRQDDPELILLTITDITERKAGEETLRQSEERYRILVESVEEYAIFMMDVEGRINMWNSGAEAIIGYREEEVIGRLGAIIFTEEQKEQGIPQAEMETAVREGQAIDERWHVRKDGSCFWASGVMTALYKPDGGLRGFVKVLRDNTKRKQAEEALVQAQESLEVAIEAAEMGTWDLDLITDQARTSQRHDQIFGYAEPISGWNRAIFFDHLLPEERVKFEERLNAAWVSGELDVDLRIRWPDGTTRWIHLIGRVYYNEQDKPVRMAGVTVDITERKEAEVAVIRRQILQAQELERTYLAHEIHDGPVQELAALTFEIVALAARLEDESLQTVLAVINAKLERNIRLLRHIMVTLRPPAVANFGLATALQSHVEDFRQQQPELAVDLDMDADLPVLPEEMVLGIYRICQQALYNIVQHARASKVWVRLYRQDAHLVLEAEDNGVGFVMPEQLIDLPRRKHLGIVGMMERASAIGGELTVRSAPDQGTLVRVLVPLSDA
jgi:two-component system, chemotaxis family, CheB/CheR fusion protein